MISKIYYLFDNDGYLLPILCIKHISPRTNTLLNNLHKIRKEDISTEYIILLISTQVGRFFFSTESGRASKLIQQAKTIALKRFLIEASPSLVSTDLLVRSNSSTTSFSVFLMNFRRLIFPSGWMSFFSYIYLLHGLYLCSLIWKAQSRCCWCVLGFYRRRRTILLSTLIISFCMMPTLPFLNVTLNKIVARKGSGTLQTYSGLFCRAFAFILYLLRQTIRKHAQLII